MYLMPLAYAIKMVRSINFMLVMYILPKIKKEFVIKRASVRLPLII